MANTIMSFEISAIIYVAFYNFGSTFLKIHSYSLTLPSFATIQKQLLRTIPSHFHVNGLAFFHLQINTVLCSIYYAVDKEVFKYVVYGSWAKRV